MKCIQFPWRVALVYLCFLLLVMCPFHSVCEAVEPNQVVSIEEIKSAWNRRSARINNFIFNWSSAEIRKASTIALEVDDYPEEIINSDKTSTLNASLRCILDNSNQIRIEENTQHWSPKNKSYVPLERISAFYGGKATHFIPKSNLEYPNASILKSSSTRVAEHMLIVPLRLVYRTIDANVGIFHPDTRLAIGEQVVIGGRDCIAITGLQPRETGVEITVYADISRDYLPVRYESSSNSSDLLQSAEITNFSQSKDNLWVPSQWEAVRLYESSGEPAWLDRASVDTYEFNVELSEKDFHITFPEGTLVADLTTNEKYILKSGNHKRFFSDEEFSVSSYEELLNTEQTDLITVTESSQSWRSWMLWGNIVLILGLSAIVYLKWNSTNPTTSRL